MSENDGLLAAERKDDEEGWVGLGTSSVSHLSCSHLEHPLKSGDESWIRAGYSAIDYCAKFETDEVSLKDL